MYKSDDVQGILRVNNPLAGEASSNQRFVSFTEDHEGSSLDTVDSSQRRELVAQQGRTLDERQGTATSKVFDKVPEDTTAVKTPPSLMFTLPNRCGAGEAPPPATVYFYVGDGEVTRIGKLLQSPSMRTKGMTTYMAPKPILQLLADQPKLGSNIVIIIGSAANSDGAVGKIRTSRSLSPSRRLSPLPIPRKRRHWDKMMTGDGEETKLETEDKSVAALGSSSKSKRQQVSSGFCLPRRRRSSSADENGNRHPRNKEEPTPTMPALKHVRGCGSGASFWEGTFEQAVARGSASARSNGGGVNDRGHGDDDEDDDVPHSLKHSASTKLQARMRGNQSRVSMKQMRQPESETKADDDGGGVDAVRVKEGDDVEPPAGTSLRKDKEKKVPDSEATAAATDASASFFDDDVAFDNFWAKSRAEKELELKANAGHGEEVSLIAVTKALTVDWNGMSANEKEPFHERQTKEPTNEIVKNDGGEENEVSTPREGKEVGGEDQEEEDEMASFLYDPRKDVQRRGCGLDGPQAAPEPVDPTAAPPPSTTPKLAPTAILDHADTEKENEDGGDDDDDDDDDGDNEGLGLLIAKDEKAEEENDKEEIKMEALIAKQEALYAEQQRQRDEAKAREEKEKRRIADKAATEKAAAEARQMEEAAAEMSRIKSYTCVWSKGVAFCISKNHGDVAEGMQRIKMNAKVSPEGATDENGWFAVHVMGDQFFLQTTSADGKLYFEDSRKVNLRAKRNISGGLSSAAPHRPSLAVKPTGSGGSSSSRSSSNSSSTSRSPRVVVTRTSSSISRGHKPPSSSAPPNRRSASAPRQGTRSSGPERGATATAVPHGGGLRRGASSVGRNAGASNGGSSSPSAPLRAFAEKRQQQQQQQQQQQNSAPSPRARSSSMSRAERSKAPQPRRRTEPSMQRKLSPKPKPKSQS